MIKCLIFDLDDTLYYEKTYVLGAFRKVCEYLGRKYDKDINKLHERCIEILDTYGRGKIFDILCEENNFKDDIAKLVDIYRNSKPQLEMYRDSIEFIEYIKRENIKTGIITDGCSKVQWNKIRALGLEKIIDKIIVTDDYGQGYSKPHEKSYIDILKCFKVKPNECIYIGDNPEKDFIGAKRLGIGTVRIVRTNGDHINKIVSQEYEAQYIINSFKDIFSILKM